MIRKLDRTTSTSLLVLCLISAGVAGVVPSDIRDLPLFPPILILLAGAMTFISPGVMRWRGPLLQKRAAASDGRTSWAIWGLRILCAIVVAVLFLLPLFRVWLTGETNYSLIGGLLPYNDAQGYLFGALDLLQQHSLPEWTQRRPITVAVMALYLRIFDNSLPAALIAQAVIAGVSAFLATYVVFRSIGVWPAVLFLSVLLLFLDAYIPTTLTETLGLTLGSLAFTVLWVAVERRSILIFSTGLCLLTVALNARAGAFLVLLTLIIWGVFTLGTARRRWGYAIVAGIVGIGLGFVLNQMLLWAFGSGENIAHSNFAVVLYGLASGGKGWNQIYTDYPDIYAGRNSAETASLMYTLAFQKIIADPVGLLRGLWWGFSQYFNVLVFNKFQHPYYEPSDPVMRMLWRELPTFLDLLMIVSLVLLLFRRADQHLSFVWMAMLGIFLSAPVLFHDGGHRVFAATMPFTAVTLAFGLKGIEQCLSRLVLRDEGGQEHGARAAPTNPLRQIWPAAIAAVLGLGIVLSPYLAVATYEKPSFALPVCPEGQTALIIRMDQNHHLVLRSAAEGIRTFVPDVRIDDYRSWPVVYKIELRPILSRFQPGTLFAYGYNLAAPSDQRDKMYWIVADVSMVPSSARYVQFCGSIPDDPLYKRWRVYVAVSGTAVSPRAL